jgi:hypothetical protein
LKKGNSKIEYCGCTIETFCEACTKKQMDRFKKEEQRWEFFVDGIQSINQNLLKEKNK